MRKSGNLNYLSAAGKPEHTETHRTTGDILSPVIFSVCLWLSLTLIRLTL